MQDTAPNLALLGEDLELGHQVMADLRLDLRRAADIDAGGVGADVVHLLGGPQSRGRVSFGNGHPNTAPGAPLRVFRPQSPHLRRSVSIRERGLIAHWPSLSRARSESPCATLDGDHATILAPPVPDDILPDPVGWRWCVPDPPSDS